MLMEVMTIDSPKVIPSVENNSIVNSTGTFK